jgi:hypothetical protein
MSDFTVYNNLEVKVIEELDDRVKMLTDLVEAMIPLNQDMYNKIQFLEKRINLIEKVDEYQDKELETMWNNDERNEKYKCGMGNK